MKILYVKSNNEREKKYQLQTIVFEKNGEKFVKKKALCKEAIPHLMQMKENYNILTASIIDTNIHLAKIIKTEGDSLVFEFIDGISMEQKILNAIKSGDQNVIDREVDSYIKLLKTGFKTCISTPQSALIPDGKQIFESLNFTKLGDTLCFDQVSNIDLIFSNIIYRENTVYLIDYEWVLEGSVPVNYALFRAFRSLHDMDKLEADKYFTDSELTLFNAMEKRLIFFEITSANSFYQFRENFDKMRTNLYLKKSELEEEVVSLEDDINGLKDEVIGLEEEASGLKSEILYYALSKSWKITRPMRKIFTYLRGTK